MALGCSGPASPHRPRPVGVPDPHLAELAAARDALKDLAEEGTLDQLGIEGVFALLMEGGHPEAP